MTPIRDLHAGDVLNDGSGRAPNDRLLVTEDPQHIGADFWILVVENRDQHISAFPPKPGGTLCELERSAS